MDDHTKAAFDRVAQAATASFALRAHFVYDPITLPDLMRVLALVREQERALARAARVPTPPNRGGGGVTRPSLERNAVIEDALALAVALLHPAEPLPKRPVTPEYIALALVVAGDETPDAMRIIRDGLTKRAHRRCPP